MKNVILIMMVMLVASLSYGQAWEKIQGITTTRVEVNKLHGMTASTAEMNRLGGLTQNIETALNSKFSINTAVYASLTYQKKSFETELTLTDAPTITWDGSVSRNATIILGGSRTLSITNPVAGVTYRLIVKQDVTGSRVITFPTSTIWQGAKPPLSTAGYSVDKVTLIYDGTSFYTEIVKDFKTDITTNAVVVYEANEPSDTTAVASIGTNGTLINGTVVNQTGLMDKCWRFDGTNDYVNTGILSDGITTGFTYSVWIKATLPSSDVFIISRTSADYQLCRSLYIKSTGVVSFYDKGLSLGVNTSAITADTWTHIAVTYNGSDLNIYKNGVLEETKTVTGTLYTPSTNIMLGSVGFLGAYYTGYMDQISIFNSAKTASEITQLYNSGAGKVYSTWSVTPLTGTKIYYVSDTSAGSPTRKLTFTNGILTSEQ